MALTLKSLNFAAEGKSIVYLHETKQSSSIFCWTLIQSISTTEILLAWENSRHLATLTMVSPPNDVWETSAEIPYWWRITTQIWLVLLIGLALGSDASSVWNFCAHFSDVIWRANQQWVASPHVSCFLRLEFCPHLNLHIYCMSRLYAWRCIWLILSKSKQC